MTNYPQMSYLSSHIGNSQHSPLWRKMLLKTTACWCIIYLTTITQCTTLSAQLDEHYKVHSFTEPEPRPRNRGLSMFQKHLMSSSYFPAKSSIILASNNPNRLHLFCTSIYTESPSKYSSVSDFFHLTLRLWDSSTLIASLQFIYSHGFIV